jgi:large subunit ribosomal protein L21
MKKAVIVSGGHQYLVAEGETIQVELIKDTKGKLSFDPLLVIDGTKSTVGKPRVEGAKVTASIIEADVQQDKVTSIRYKAKKRVHKVRGHRQRLTTLKIDSIK